MAIVTLPSQPTAGYGMGQALGGAAAGLGEGISNIVNLKLQRMQKEQQRKSLEESLMPIVGPEKAGLYSALGAESPQTLGQLLKMETEAPQQRFYESVMGGMPTEVTQPAPGAMAAPAGLQQLQPVEQPAAPEKVGEASATDKKPSRLGNITSRLESDIQRYDSAMRSGRLAGKNFEKVLRAKEKAEKTFSNLLINEKKEAAAADRFDKKFKLQERAQDLKEKRHFDSMSSEKRKEAIAEQKEIDKQSMPTYKKVLDQAKATKANEMRLDRMSELNKKGHMGSQLINSAVSTVGKGIGGKLLGNIGLNLDFLMTEDAQEFRKLSQDFLKNVKSIFGARVTQQEVQMYLQTIPNLYQSQGGRNRVINNLKQFNKIPLLREKAMNKLLKKNNGRLPRNLESKIEKKIGPELDRIAKIFKASAVKPKGWGRAIFEAPQYLLSSIGL